jgi:hypothetical protein
MASVYAANVIIQPQDAHESSSCPPVTSCIPLGSEASRLERWASRSRITGADAVALGPRVRGSAGAKECGLETKSRKPRGVEIGWVRVNRPWSDKCREDLEALNGLVLGFRVPKVRWTTLGRVMVAIGRFLRSLVAPSLPNGRLGWRTARQFLRNAGQPPLQR